MENLELLVKELCKLREEKPYVEFKHNNYDPEMIGQDISALANGAALHEKSCAYMIWGVDDKTHQIVGTDKDLQSLKKGNQELENWLRGNLSQNADFEFQTVFVEKQRVGVLIIYKAANQTVMFRKTDYIRVGSYTKKLSDYPAMQAQVWDRLRNDKFEEQVAKQDLTSQEALNYLQYSAYFDLTKIHQPAEERNILHYMTEERILLKQDNGLYAISNMGAILFAKRLADFPRLVRKAVRVVQYKGNNRLAMIRENVGNKGYAVGFEEIIGVVQAILPTQETIDGALRNTVSAYPPLAIREMIGNALIHQDFSITGSGPLVEIFDNRVEVTNPGRPLVDVQRIIDNPPKSRNEKLASLMRRMGICEELGTGWDKIVLSCEWFRLPAPKITIYEENIKVTIFSEMPFGSISQEDKLWACYLHACIRQVESEQLTNSSLRERFGLPQTSSGSISRLIKEAVKIGVIKALDPTTAPRYMKYIPFWA